METTTRLILPEVIDALGTSPEAIVELCDELHPADLADLVTALEPALAHKLLDALPVEIGARLLEHLPEELRAELFAELAENQIDKAAALTDEMAADDRADLVADLSEELQTELLNTMDAEESRDVRQLLSYPDGTAGAIMTTDFVAVPAEATAAEAIDVVRDNAEKMESIYQAYAVDQNGTLLGVVSLRDLVTAPARRTIAEIMNPNMVSVGADDDQEGVARLIAKYDLLAVPVVDRHHKMVGMITVDDAIDVVAQEATEDVQKLGGVEPLDSTYLLTPFVDLVRARAPWLVILFVAGLATRNVLEHFSSVELKAMAMLMWFVPLINGAGGNSGSQSASLIIRALGVGSLDLRDAGRVLLRELLMGLTLGLILSLFAALSVSAFESTRFVSMVLTVSLSVVAVVTTGALLGSGIPLLLQRLKIDPAVASNPLISSLCDLTGLVVYLEIARAFLE
jgi:magnesium transporter